MSPIRPEMRHSYPPDWPQIRLRILERAGYRCECRGECALQHPGGRCMIPDRAWVWRSEDRLRWIYASTPASCMEPMGYRPRIQIVLTVAHLDHDSTDCRPEGLRALCQLCHLRYDRDEHQKHSAGTRERKRLAAAAAAGQGELFPEVRPWKIEKSTPWGATAVCWQWACPGCGRQTEEPDMSIPPADIEADPLCCTCQRRPAAPPCPPTEGV